MKTRENHRERKLNNECSKRAINVQLRGDNSVMNENNLSTEMKDLLAVIFSYPKDQQKHAIAAASAILEILKSRKRHSDSKGVSGCRVDNI